MTDPLAQALSSGYPDRDEAANKGSIDVTPEGATVNNVVVTSPINKDWSAVFALFNLDAGEFEVVDETVRMSTWQQSKRTEDGRRDLIQLYSYSARFRRVSKDLVAAETVASWRAALQVRPRTRASGPSIDTDAGTYLILVADPQLGKTGTEQAVENWKRGVTGHLDVARKMGQAIEAVHVAFMGDETENVVNSYENQPHIIELNRSRQLELDFDLRTWTLQQALELRKPVTASSVISNHGLWTRNGGKDPVTTHGDNTSTYIARQVQKLFNELAPYTKRNIDWTIGDEQPAVLMNLSGAKCYFSHAYIEKGRGPSVEVKTRNALERQILGRTEDLGDVDIFYTAHYHHFFANEFEGRTLFGCPALEAEKSSAYMLDQFGVWSPPGMLGMVVGEARHRDGWSNLNIF